MGFAWLRRVAWVLLVVVLTYVVAEAAVSVPFALASAPRLFVVCEGEGDLIRFDPVTGLRLSERPWRMAQIQQGELEFLSTVRGNSLGFPDRDDFGPGRADPAVPRVAVLGDSFTAGLHLDVNWPDRVEDLLGAQRPVELLNFSLPGIGLQNWWRTVRDLLEADAWQVDAVVFAVWGNDLFRRFHLGDAGSGDRLQLGRVVSWDTAQYPDDLREAQRWLRPSRMYRVSGADFDRALRGTWTPPLTWRPRLAEAWLGGFSTAFSTAYSSGSPAVSALAPGRSVPRDGALWTSGDLDDTRAGMVRSMRQQIDDMATWIRSRGLRCLVVFIPPKPFLVPDTPPDRRPLADYVRAVSGFSQQLGARYVDGGLAFSEIPPDRRADFFPAFDLHWNQRGSDRFAQFMRPRVAELVAGLPISDGH